MSEPGIARPQLFTFEVQAPDQRVHYRLYRTGKAGAARLLMLHGSGVGGDLTWGLIMRRLSGWAEILVPDLRGTGRTRHPLDDDPPFTHEEVRGDLGAVLHAQGWDRFDLAGYSFGGMIAMLLRQELGDRVGRTFLLEPALLDRESIHELTALREHYSEIVRILRQPGVSPEAVRDAIRAFLDLVSPRRTRAPRSESATVERLANRPLGFANALDCVTRAVHQVDRAALIDAQARVECFAGERSNPRLLAFHAYLASCREDWNCHVIPGADHALPFQKPDRIAAIMDAAAT